MNILHMKYAVEVAKAGSLNKAAENLLIAAPNVSRSIKELEADIGISIFERTAKGMELTPEGEEFINYAKGILNQIEEVENFYKKGSSKKQQFSISVPRACYISEAFSQFSKSLSKDAAEISRFGYAGIRNEFGFAFGRLRRSCIELFRPSQQNEP